MFFAFDRFQFRAGTNGLSGSVFVLLAEAVSEKSRENKTIKYVLKLKFMRFADSIEFNFAGIKLVYRRESVYFDETKSPELIN